MYVKGNFTVGKITKVTPNHITMRKCSYGNTTRGYSYQHRVRRGFLNTQHKKGRVTVIPVDKLLQYVLWGVYSRSVEVAGIRIVENQE